MTLEEAIKAMTDKDGGWGDRVAGFTETIIEICEHYAEKLGGSALDIFNALEEARTYSYPNYYQWAKFPKLDDVEIFETVEDLKSKLDISKGFRCPSCSGVSKDPYVCDSGLDMAPGKKCDWKAYGLFGTMGKGVRILIKSVWHDKPFVDSIFYPIAWEE